jgi:heme-degrading monooxygenase HmoA
MGVAATPQPPYYAVIFTSVRTGNDAAYDATAARMVALSEASPGFLGMEHARDGETGITICYWSSLEAIRAWKQNAEHKAAQHLGKTQWYADWQVRVCKVERVEAPL